MLKSAVASAALGAMPAIAAEGERGLYLPELAAAEAAAAGGDRSKLQRLAWQRAFVGDERGALNAWASQRTRPWPPLELDFTGVTAEPALPAILKAAKGRRIVILNEAHHVSRCRAFAATVARALRAEGFDILAAEGFNSKPDIHFDARMAAGEAVIDDFGFYTMDPVFAELMRQGRSDGYRLMAYEQRPDQKAPEDADAPARTAARETAQAANLDAILQANPNSRVLVYCGFSHLAETPQDPTTWMAARLKTLTGIDPLTIDQSDGSPMPQNEPPLIGAVLSRFNPREPIVVRDADGSVLGGPLAEAVDLSVFHPRLDDIDGRPGWLASAPDRKRRTWRLPPGLPPGVVIQAVPASEAATPGVIPADQYRLAAGAKKAVFHLRPGAYEVRVETEAGRRVLGRL